MLGGMLTRPKTTGAGKVVRFRRRKQKRNPRRLLEAVPADWSRWDATAKQLGLNWSELTRRALNAYSLAHSAQAFAETGVRRLGNLHPEAEAERAAIVSEKGAPKTARANGAKSRASSGARKG